MIHVSHLENKSEHFLSDFQMPVFLLTESTINFRDDNRDTGDPRITLILGNRVIRDTFSPKSKMFDRYIFLNSNRSII